MEIIASSKVYDQFANEYDNWFEKHSNLYQSELLAMKQAIPQNKTGIEIGVGTGRFAEPLGIKYGVEPSATMAALAKQRGINVFNGIAENLPLENQSYDFATMVTTVCFLKDIPKALSEVYRILKPPGEFIIGLIDRNSELGKKYKQQMLTTNPEFSIFMPCKIAMYENEGQTIISTMNMQIMLKAIQDNEELYNEATALFSALKDLLVSLKNTQ